MDIIDAYYNAYILQSKNKNTIEFVLYTSYKFITLLYNETVIVTKEEFNEIINLYKDFDFIYEKIIIVKKKEKKQILSYDINSDRWEVNWK